MSILGAKLFENEHALVTGAASNIGRSMAVHLAGEGARVTLTDIDEDRMATVADEISKNGGSVRSIVSDLSNTTGWRAVWEQVEDDPADMFVHSACPPRHEKDLPLDVTEETFDAMLNTNLRSGFLLGRKVAKAMHEAGKSGRLLYLTSLHASAPRNLVHYSSSKAAVTMVVKELARELGPKGIRVNAVAPGAIPGGGSKNTDDSFQPAKKIPLVRFGHADDIARASMALLSNDFMSYVTGTTLVVDGGLQLFNWIDFSNG